MNTDRNESARHVMRLLIRCTHTTSQALPSVVRLATVRKLALCMNCLPHGHYASQCHSSPQCKKCCGSHPTLLHQDTDKATRETVPKVANVNSSKKPPEKVISNFVNRIRGSVLLMTCQVIVQGPNGSTARARALLNSGSKASFITERLAQQLGLSRCRGPLIMCTGETSPPIRLNGLV